MEAWGYTFEPIKVLTDDGYTLTTFHVTGISDLEEQAARDPELNPLIIMYGITGDAVNWVNFDVDGLKPTPLRLFD